MDVYIFACFGFPASRHFVAFSVSFSLWIYVRRTFWLISSYRNCPFPLSLRCTNYNSFVSQTFDSLHLFFGFPSSFIRFSFGFRFSLFFHRQFYHYCSLAVTTFGYAFICCRLSGYPSSPPSPFCNINTL